MAKLSKSALKEVIKECLIEILAEGLSSGNTNTLQENFNSFESKPVKRQTPKKVKNKNFDANTKTAIKSVTSDPIMSSIFADTAKTTLQEQIGAEKHGIVQGGDMAQNAVASSNPEELFGETSSNWANLAFSD